MRAFLSHSSKQKNLISRVAANLGKANCIYDDYEFEAGLKIFDEVLRGLEETELFVLFLSEDSLSSDWVKKEITETKQLVDFGKSKNIFPIIVDQSISSSDERIPRWLKEYLLKPLLDPFIISKKIKQRLRELSIETNPLYKAKETLFVGRNEIFDAFEASIFSISDKKPNSIIVSGLDGIGRRTFLKTALKRANKIKDYYEPIYITLDTKDSIEDFIIKFQDFENETSTDFLEMLMQLSLEEKIDEAKQLLSKIQDSNEHIFIIDSGCIVRPTMQVAEWYLELIKDQKHRNVLSLCLISKFRPTNSLLKTNRDILHLHLTTLSENDTEKLFVKYSTLLGLDLSEEDSIEILKVLNGIPAQVHYAVERINEFGIRDTLRGISDLIDFGETQVYYLIEQVKSKGDFPFELLKLISNFDFISYDFIYTVTQNIDKTNKYLDEFFIMGIFDLVGANKEYIKVHYPIQDYLKRSKQKLKQEYLSKLRQSIKQFVTENEEASDFRDISQLLFNIKGAILDGVKLSDRYYIPSFVLKTIVELYYKGNYKNVIELIDKVLQNSKKLEDSLRREFQYWLCLSLARMSNQRFELEIEKMDGSDYSYLYGFYYRFKRDYDKAQKFLNQSLKTYPNFQRAKRELVNILLMKEDYGSALEISRQNYQHQKLNAFHIQAYFICIIRKPYLSKEDKTIIGELFRNIERSHDPRSKEITNVMKGEFEYYINRDIPKAITILRECVSINIGKHYPLRALKEIYTKNKITVPLNELITKYSKLNQTFID